MFKLPDNYNDFPRVTTILQTLAKEGLTNWYIKQGAKIQREHKPANENELLEIFNSNSDGIKNRGTDIHGLIETYFKTGKHPTPPPHLVKFYAGFKKLLKEHEVSPLLNETPIFSAKHGYRGTCDFLGYFDNDYSIIDWKTNEKGYIYPEVELQLSAYRHALWEMGHKCLRAKRRVIVFTIAGDYKTKVLGDKQSFKLFTNIINLYHWRKKTENQWKSN